MPVQRLSGRARLGSGGGAGARGGAADQVTAAAAAAMLVCGLVMAVVMLHLAGILKGENGEKLD